MDKSLFCKECGMIKSRCICSKIGVKPSYKSRLSETEISLIKRSYPDIDPEIIENFPFPHPREGQLDIIGRIKDAVDQGYRYILLEAGTGTGKSAVAATLCNLYGSAYILTMTKQLQSQYREEFGYTLVKGRGNFRCKDADLAVACDRGTCQTTPDSRKFFCHYGISKEAKEGYHAFEASSGYSIYFNSPERCNYWSQKAEAIKSPITLMNYDYALLELNYVKHFGKRELMVLDEAHNIENKLMQRLEVKLSNRRLEKDIKKTIPPQMLSYQDPVEWILFIESIYGAYKDIELKDLPKNRADRIRRTQLRLEELALNLKERPENWVVDHNPDVVAFKPLKVDMYGEHRLFSHANISLFMSATILNHRLFSKWLGIDYDEVYSHQIKSSFPASKRPVYVRPVGNMSRRAIKRTAPRTIPSLQRIIDHHKYEKGLIHTHNYKCQKYIMDHIQNSRLISHTSFNREQKLRQFEESKRPLVLVSPSMSEGVDLPYEKCQFQVIYKIPFPYLGDKQINHRKQQDPKWYAYKTVMILVQAYGRGMRAEDDYCVTYILDGNIKMLFNNRLYKNLIPQFLKEAVQRE